MIPRQLRRVGWQRVSDWLVLDDDEQTVTLSRLRAGRLQTLASCPASAVASLEAVRRQDRALYDLPVAIRMPRQAVLQRRIVMPPSARGELGRILAFEIERLAPMPTNLAAFDYRIVDVARHSRQLTIELIIVERTALDERLERARRAGLAPSYAGPQQADGAFPSAYNLLQSARPAVRRGYRVAVAAAALLAVALWAAALHSSLSLLDAQIAVLESALSTARQQAEAATHLRDEVTALESRSSLIERYRSFPSPLDALAEVAARLPDDAWLVQFRFQKGAVRLHGYAAQASHLIGNLSGSSILADARFASPVTRDREAELERFDLSLRLPQEVAK
jgi:general secretion pathway protein L